MGNTYPRAVELAKKELGKSSGGIYLERESWFWNSKVQETVDQKKNAFKEWQRVKDRPETDPEEAEAKERDYREKNKTGGMKSCMEISKKMAQRTSTSLPKQGKEDLKT